MNNQRIMKDQNYYHTFSEVADDCPVKTAEIPIQKSDEKSVPFLQYELIANHPYENSQEDILFTVFAIRNHINEQDLAKEREKFFSKGQPCLRSSSLGKRYGWGIHCNELGKVALFARESVEYQKLSKDKSIKHVKAMNSKRKKGI